MESELDLEILFKRMEKIKMDELFAEPSTWEDDEHMFGHMSYDYEDDVWQFRNWHRGAWRNLNQ